MGFRNPMTAATSVDDGNALAPLMLAKGPGANNMFGQPTTKAALQLGTSAGTAHVSSTPTYKGNNEVDVSTPSYFGGGFSQLLLRNHPTDEGAAVEIKSVGDIALTPAAGYGVNTGAAPFAAGSLANFRFIAPTLVLTDANARATFNFPVPFPSTCWFVQAAPTGDFGYSFNWSVVSWTKTGCVIRAGKNDGTLLPSTSLFVQLWAAGV